MSNNAEKIARLRKEADELEAADKAFRELPEEHRLAITLHDMLCRWNHTDGCSWHYESKNGIADWGGHAHGEYLGKARRVVAFCGRCKISPDEAIDLLKLMGQ